MNKLEKTLSLMERMNYVGKPYMLTESQESSSQKEAIRYVEQHLGWSHEKANNFVRIDLRNDITALRDKKIGKFTLGVTRMFCNRELSDASIISDLNSTLKLLSAHLNEYDRNLNGLSAQELIQRFAQTRQNNLDAEKDEINAMEFGDGSNYKIVPINSFEEAQQYYQYTNPKSRWCLTHMENMFNSYTCNGINQIYFCLQNGFENISPKVGESAPLDEYGLSMLSIIVNERGELAYCTTRWNHDNGGSDSSMSAKEISQVVGVNFYDVFKPNNKWQEMIAQVKQRLANGEHPKDVFDLVGLFREGFAMVKLNGKYNFINQENQLLSNRWYDRVEGFQNGFAKVRLGKKWNFINQEGQPITDRWYDWVGDFYEGFAEVEFNGKWNFINQEGQPITDQWFDLVGLFREGFAKVQLGEKFNFINQEKQLINDQWYDEVWDLTNGFAKVRLGKKFNFINREKQLINDQWYDEVWGFQNGFAEVKFNGKWNFINQEGQPINNQWYDDVNEFYNGFAIVRLGEKFNFINQEGQPINNQWYDGVWGFQNGFAKVRLGQKYKFINQKGHPINDQWYDKAMSFRNGFAAVELNGKYCQLDTNGRLHNINENKVYEKINKNMKQVIRLTESDLHRVIKESVKRVLRENEQFSNLAEIDSYVAQNQGVNSQELACVVADCMHDNQIPFNSIYQCKNLMQCVDPNAVKMELRKLVQRNIEQTRQQRDLWKTNQEY